MAVPAPRMAGGAKLLGSPEGGGGIAEALEAEDGRFPMLEVTLRLWPEGVRKAEGWSSKLLVLVDITVSPRCRARKRRRVGLGLGAALEDNL